MSSIVSKAADVLIVGGGPAGLAAALSLSRQRHTTVIFDSGAYRNALTKHMHNVPTWDHADPAKYRAAAREELLTRYRTNRFVDLAVTSVEKNDSGLFKAVDKDGGEWTGKKLILAVGNTDVLPNLPGYEDCWTKGIFHCLYCHGYEERAAPSVGVLTTGNTANAMHANKRARQALRFADEVTIYTHGDEQLGAEIELLVKGKPITVDNRQIKRFHKDPEGSYVTVELDNGDKVRQRFIAHAPNVHINLDFASSLGLQLAATGIGAEIQVQQPFQETNVKGCFAAGDAATIMKTAGMAIQLGGLAGVGAADQLQTEG